MTKHTAEQVQEKVDPVYRSDSRRIFATLIRVSGDFELAKNLSTVPFDWLLRIAESPWESPRVASFDGPVQGLGRAAAGGPRRPQRRTSRTSRASGRAPTTDRWNQVYGLRTEFSPLTTKR